MASSTQTAPPPTDVIPVRNHTADELLGHPKCLFTLFFTELWERFSFYGMKALLILYMVNFFLWSQKDASRVMAWYAGLVYFTPLFGGLLADRVFGARWSVVIGGVLMAIGHFLLAFQPLPFFYSGLGFLIVGCGFLKPNISTQVGALYHPDDRRRDSAFTIFYMGINSGAFLGPIICGWLRVRYGYHYGFAAAGVGMVLGLIVYLFGMRSVVRRTKAIAAQAGTPLNQDDTPETTPAHVYRDRMIVMLIMFVFAIVFWMAFEQAANVMNLWADKHTNLFAFRAQAPAAVVPPLPGDAAAAAAAPATGPAVGWTSFQLGAEQLQSVNPLFIITLAAVFAWLWIFLDKRKLQPSTPLKMTLGLFFVTLAYGLMLAAATRENQPTSAPLAAAPPNVKFEEYGATRLRYDAQAKLLRMNGILTDIDRLRVLADASPLTGAMAPALKRLEAPDAGGKLPETATVTLSDDVATGVRREALPENATWDPQTRQLTLPSTIVAERVRLPFLAAHAPRELRTAVDSLYQQSSTLRVSVLWLILFYLVVTIGELCLSPVGLSFVTKATPPKYVGLFMGLWFLATGGVANYAANSIGGMWGTMTPTQYFMIFGALTAAATLIMLLSLRLLKPRLHGLR